MQVYAVLVYWTGMSVDTSYRCVCWHTGQVWVLIHRTGVFVDTLDRYDCAMPVWSCAWNADDRNCFYAGLQNGTVLMFDIRDLTEPVLTLNQDTGSRSPVVSVQYMPAVTASSVRYYWNLLVSVMDSVNVLII